MNVIGLVVILSLVATAACTKQNPNLCCTDEADCAAQGLSTDAQCAEGLLCRGNQCIAVTCNGSSDCDASAPYCVDSSCSESCADDGQCPGFGQTTASHCVAGECVECRTDVAADCGINAPICDAGTCRACKLHKECATGICTPQGTCAAESEIAFVAADGSASSACTKDTPCSLERAFALQPTKVYVRTAAGIYNTASGVVMSGNRLLVGVGTVSIRRATPGPIVTIGPSSDLTIENVTIESATSSDPNYGTGIVCPGDPIGTRVVRLKNVDVRSCMSVGITADRCSIIGLHATIRNNMAGGIYTIDSDLALDASSIADNAGTALAFDSGTLSLTNSFVVRNGGGIEFNSASTANRIEFNTIADNGAATAGLSCNPGNSQLSAPNNLFARNTPNTFGSKCTLPGSLTVDNDISAIRFVSPNAMPYDYHLSAGSLAIDAATISTIDHDYDGDARPTGVGRDVGADEYLP